MSYKAPNFIGNTGIYVTNVSGSDVSVISVTGIKTSELPSLNTIGSGDIIPFVYNSGGTYFNRTITYQNLATGLTPSAVGLPVVPSGYVNSGAYIVPLVISSGGQNITVRASGNQLQTIGNFLKRTLVTGANYNVTTDDHLIAVNSPVTTNKSIVLPTGAYNKIFIIKDEKGDASLYNIVITVTGNGPIDNGNTASISGDYGVFSCYCPSGNAYMGLGSYNPVV